MNIEIFAQYIFSRISRSALDARKYDVSEKMKHYRSNRINYEIRENLSTRKCHQGLDARKFSCAKISAFTVNKMSNVLSFRIPKSLIRASVDVFPMNMASNLINVSL